MEYHSRERESRGTGSLKRKMLKFLGIERAFGQSICTSRKEGIRMDAPPVCSYSKQIESALLEAERKKAEALHACTSLFGLKKTNQ